MTKEQTRKTVHGLPGQSDLDSRWFEGQNAFEQQEVMRQVSFKAAQWPSIPHGSFSKSPDDLYPHILPNFHKLVFHESIANEVHEYLNKNHIQLHSEALNLKSSQVCCFNFLFPLKQDPVFAANVLKPFFNNLSSVDRIEFEYTGPKEITEWLGEPAGGKRGQNRTSIDTAVWWNDSNSIRHITLIEWKYTERSFGECGGYKSKKSTQSEKYFCETFQVAANMSKAIGCALTSGKTNRNRNYWELLSSAGISLGALARAKGCPFKGPLYQLMRQHLVAAYMRQANAGCEVDVLSVGFRGNTALRQKPPDLAELDGNTVIDTWNTALLGVPPMRHLDVEKIMEHVDTLQMVNMSWRQYLKDRYGV